jgi:hypothetical protein
MLSIALVLAAASVTKQMAPAKQGMVQCHMPDVLFKTCTALTKVWQVGPDSFRFESEIAIDPDGPIVVTERNTVRVQGTQACETVRLSAIDSWPVKIAGAPASPAQAARVRAALKRKFAPLSGKVTCYAIVPNDQQMETVQTSIGGKRTPALDYAMKWVSPKDSWTVAP